MPFVNFEETSKLIGYDNNLLTEEIKVVDNTERSIRSNYFLTKPQGIIIQDTYNNFLFPIRPRPRLDTKKCDLIELTHWYRQLYLSFKSNFLPWHFVVEFIDGRYYVFNTRPIDIRSILVVLTLYKFIRNYN